MAQPRWRKVFADLRANKTRTILTILTIAVGVFAIGFVVGTGAIILHDTDADYAGGNAHSAMIYTDPFGDDVLQAVRGVEGVADVEGRVQINGRLIAGDDRKINIAVDGIPPLSEMRIDLLRPADPKTPLTLNDGEMWIERSSLQVFKMNTGEVVKIEMSKGLVKELRVVAFVHDVSMPAAVFDGAIRGFVTPATIASLGGPADHNKILLRVAENPKDEKHVSAVAQAIGDRLREGGRTVYETWIYNPGEHFSREIMVGVMWILYVLGGAAVFLSTFLVINTINSLLSQHIRQIGIMKAVGGRNSQIIGMYLVLVLSFGLLALAIAVPLAAMAAYGACGGLANFVNIHLQGFRVTPQAIVAQVFTALLVPLAAAAVPVISGTRVSVREAISDYGMKNGHFGQSWVDRLVEKVHFLSRPMLLSLRNTFRRKGRLALTLSTLTLGGAIFIAVFNLWATFDKALDDVQGYFLADVNVTLGRSYRFEDLKQLTMSIPNVSGVEGWGWAEAQVLSDDPSKAEIIGIAAPPSNSKLIQPVIIKGRWLLPEDQNAIVIDHHLLVKRPDLKVGDDVVIKLYGQETTWHVVGFYKMIGNTTPPIVYTNAEILDRFQKEPGMVSSLRVITEPHDAPTQRRVAKALEEALGAADVRISQMLLGVDWKAQQASTFNVLIYFLLVMAVLIALVGGLGLTGTMSMNVLERTREIGVLRAVGAPNGAILRMVVAEGVTVGLLSWLLALVISFPLTRILDVGVGSALFKQTLDFAFGLNGMAIWLAGVLVLSALASALPALRAVRLTVRDVLAYE